MPHDPMDINANVDALSPALSGGVPAIPTIGALTPGQLVAADELRAREEEARAFRAIELRDNTAARLAAQAAATHAPTDGAAAQAALGIPSISAAPVALPVAPSLAPTVPAVAPVAAPRTRRAAAPVTTPAPPNAVATAEAAQAAAMEEMSAEEQIQLTEQSEVLKRQERDHEVERRLQSLDRQEMDQRITEAREKASTKKLKGFYEDSAIAQDVATGISAIMGSFSFSDNHTNQAVQIIDRAMARYADKQEKEKADLWKNVEVQLQQGQQLRHDQIREMADFRVNQAMAIEAVIAQSKAAMSKTKNKEALRAFEVNNKRLEFQRDHILDESKRLWSMANETKRHNITAEGIAREDNRIKATRGIDDKLAARIVRDPVTGEELGMAPRPGDVSKLAGTISKVSTYEHAIYKLADHIEKHGHMTGYNPFGNTKFGPIYKERENLIADVQAMGRPLKEIQGTDAGAKLEHEVIGGSGLGATRAADPKVLRHLAVQARQQVNEKMRAMLTPMPGQERSGALSGGNDPHTPVGLPSGYTDTGRTIGGKPVYRTAEGKLMVAQ